MLGIGSAVEIEDDSGAVDLDVGDDHAGARLGGEAFADDHVQIASPAGSSLPLAASVRPLWPRGNGRMAKPCSDWRARISSRRVLGSSAVLSNCDVRGLDLRVPPVHRAGGGDVSLALGIDGENLGRAA